MPFFRPWAHFPGFTVSKTVDRALISVGEISKLANSNFVFFEGGGHMVSLDHCLSRMLVKSR